MENLFNLNFANVIGYIALVLGTLALLIKDKSKFTNYAIFVKFLTTFHYFLLGNYTQTGLQAFSMTRNILAKLFEGNKKVAYLIIGIGIIIFSITYTEWYDFLSIIAFSSVTLGFFFFDKIQMRLLFLTGTICYIIVALFSGSLPMAIMESIVLVIHIKTILYYIKKEEMCFKTEFINIFKKKPLNKKGFFNNY